MGVLLVANVMFIVLLPPLVCRSFALGVVSLPVSHLWDRFEFSCIQKMFNGLNSFTLLCSAVYPCSKPLMNES